MPPDPEPDDLPTARPDVAHPGVRDGELRITWVGHATHVLQLPGLNLLTDPMWSKTASPAPFLGAERFVPPRPSLDRLPCVHGILLSHGHFDHLDRPTVVALRNRFGPELRWYTPLGYRGWFERRGVRNVVELDWWEAMEIPGTGYRLVSTPARHWTRRTPWDTNRRLWCSWAVVPLEDDGIRVYFGGDSG
ncbi:MAG: MBL fold metallo-hydrolase, partial [Gemmatimonadetes bacterium]|nr:MBL fold metallo-hydrolase [Gemmatimonadota bacterium]NIT86981.1 MBL fold metallo-hydrolase [Gemmatimonadota bacterium]NIU30825.1 MBL fold metallo-hydrolase [Gemmatimonadota bacterium]NIV61193.1 MBL fold metallo-hydrolase [Gemmatimonadota bacterium]NIW63888.1 MBL fold metallo-hydrolase [Gemmatimonadota bacterium]